MFNFFITRPIVSLLTVAGVAVLAPVIFPIMGIILKPIVNPLTNLYLDLADEMADAFEERQERMGHIKPEVDRAELKRLMEEVVENKMRLSEETAAAEHLIGKL
jgi:hypothetical protein